jgi:hypothetical protein
VAERREDLRAADVDREFVAQRLKSALDEGRLTLTEYDERLRDAYGARTYGELDQVLADLPSVRPAQRSQVARPAATAPEMTAGEPAHRSVPKWLAANWGAWALAVGINVVIWFIVAATGAGFDLYFWPAWVAGPWGVVLLFGTVKAIASGQAPENHDEHRSNRDARRAARRAARRG